MSDKIDTILVWIIGLLFFVALVLYSDSPVFGDEWQFEVVQPQKVGKVLPTTVSEEVKASEFYVVMFSADYCGVCQVDKKLVLPELKKVMPLSGVIDVAVESSWTKRQYINFRGKDQNHNGVRLLPTYWLIEQDRNGKRVIVEEWVGRTNHKTILDKLHKITSNTSDSESGTVVNPERTPSIYNGRRGNSHENRSSLINHLLNEGIHEGKHSEQSLNAMSDLELNSLHSSDHK